MQSVNKLKVGCLGSCRVYTPIRQAGERGDIEFVSNEIFGFQHNTKEILQSLHLMDGQKNAPEALRHLLSIVAPKRLAQRAGNLLSWLEEIDILVIEISSLRCVEFGEWNFQINNFRKMLEGIPEATSLVPKMHRNVEGWAQEVENVTPILPSELASMLRKIVLYEQSSREILADLDQICRLVGKKILFVSLFTHDFQGNAVRQRVEVAEALRVFTAARQNTSYFDPTPHVDSYGKTEALRDLGHYTEDFEAEMSRILVDFLQAFSWDAA